MAAPAVSLFLFLVVTSLQIPHSAGKEEWSKKCPPFYCCNSTSLEFPFTEKGRPECGLFLIDGCHETVQKIQLEKGRRWYTLEGILQLEKEKRWKNIIIIHDDVLLQSPDCEFFSNLSLPNIPFISFHIPTRVDVLNCSKSPPNNTIPKDFTPSHGSCNRRSVYYRIHDGPAQDTKDHVPPNCSLVIGSHLKNLTSYTEDLFTPLTANLSLVVEIHPDLLCRGCRKGGECPSLCDPCRGCRKGGECPSFCDPCLVMTVDCSVACKMAIIM